MGACFVVGHKTWLMGAKGVILGSAVHLSQIRYIIWYMQGRLMVRYSNVWIFRAWAVYRFNSM